MVIVSRSAAVRLRPAVTVAPVTRTIRGIRSEVALGTDEGLRHPSVANCDNLETVSKARLSKRIASLDGRKLAQLDRALRYALGIRG